VVNTTDAQLHRNLSLTIAINAVQQSNLNKKYDDSGRMTDERYYLSQNLYDFVA